MLGANLTRDGCEFRVWAPSAKSVVLRIWNQRRQQDLPMESMGEHFVLWTEARAGDQYQYIVDGSKPVPDPVSRLLREGVHGPTEIVDPQKFIWSDQQWLGLPLSRYMLYELHLGTFTPQGTF